MELNFEIINIDIYELNKTQTLGLAEQYKIKLPSIPETETQANLRKKLSLTKEVFKTAFKHPGFATALKDLFFNNILEDKDKDNYRLLVSFQQILEPVYETVNFENNSPQDVEYLIPRQLLEKTPIVTPSSSNEDKTTLEEHKYDSPFDLTSNQSNESSLYENELISQHENLLKIQSTLALNQENSEAQILSKPNVVNTQKIMTEEPKEKLPLIKAGTFSGLPSEDVHEFLHKFKTASVCNHWTEKTKIELFPTHLTSTPYKWFSLYKQEHNTIDWNDLEQEFVKAFSPVALIEDLQTVLDNRTQGDNESPMQFLYEIIHLCKRIEPDMTDKKVIEHVIQGIKPEICNEIIKMENNTLGDLKDNLYKIETQYLLRVKNQRRYQKQSEHVGAIKPQIKTVSYADTSISGLKSEIRELKETLANLNVTSTQQGTSHRSPNRDKPKTSNGRDTSPYYSNDRSRDRFRHRCTSRESTFPTRRHSPYKQNQSFHKQSSNNYRYQFKSPHRSQPHLRSAKFCNICKMNNHSTENCGFNTHNNRAKQSQIHNTKWCSYCKRNNHTIDQCFRRPVQNGRFPKND